MKTYICGNWVFESLTRKAEPRGLTLGGEAGVGGGAEGSPTITGKKEEERRVINKWGGRECEPRTGVGCEESDNSGRRKKA